MCDECGTEHWSPSDKSKCFTVIRANGDKPLNWDTKSHNFKTKTDARAEEYKRLGPYKSRTTSDGGSNIRALLTTLLATLPSVSAHSIVPQWSTILVDSGNLNKTGPSYHLIRDIGLFTSFDNTIPSYPIVTGNGTTTNQGGGTCTFFTENGLLTSMTKCLHVPGLPENLLSVKAAAEQGVMIRFENVNTITFPDGSYVGFSPDTYSLRIRPVTDLLASASVITRGKHGVTHFTSPTLSQNDHNWHKALALWSARFNDPPASVLNSLHKYVKNVPEILRKATDSNTITDAKLLASGRRMPTKTPEEPIATVPGAVTAVDYWSAGLRSTLTGTAACFPTSTLHRATSSFIR